MSILRLYHGSNVVFNVVDLSKSRDRRDFGKGFYMTTIRAQAEQWASTIYERYGGNGRFLYEFDLDLSDDLNYKNFAGLTGDWLEMISVNRIKGGIQHGYDIIQGPIANDNTMLTISLFIDGVYSEETALRELAYFRANDQVSIHTEKSLSHLRLIQRLSI